MKNLKEKGIMKETRKKLKKKKQTQATNNGEKQFPYFKERKIKIKKKIPFQLIVVFTLLKKMRADSLSEMEAIDSEKRWERREVELNG